MPYDWAMSDVETGLDDEGDDFALPRELEHVVEGLHRRVISISGTQLERPLGRSPDGTPLAFTHLRSAAMAENALKDLRALINAYAHAVAQPRPHLQSIAGAQGVTPSNLRRRYKPAHVAAVRELMAERSVVDVVQFAFPTVTDQQLVGISRQLDGDLALRERLRKFEFEYRMRHLTEAFGSWRAKQLADSDTDALFREWLGSASVVDRDFSNLPLSMLQRNSVEGAAAELGSEYREYLAREVSSFESMRSATG